MGVRPALLLAGAAVAVGGLVQSRKIAETMSKKITPMSEAAGFTANLVTAALVVAASLRSLPVSTTHVSCGALFGIGVANGSARGAVIAHILLAWVTTLPLGAACGAGIALALR
jgi:inorganic phosphate transporter, PiT family